MSTKVRMMQHKVIIYGFGSIGVKIAEVLKTQNYEVVIAEKEKELYLNAVNKGFEAYNFDLMQDEELLKIGIKQNIKALFCVSTSDKSNLFVTLSARNLNNNVKIISTANTKSESKKMILAGANKIINQHELGALRIFRLLHKPLLLELFDNIVFSDSNLNIAEFTIADDSKAHGVYLRDFEYANEHNILILGITDKELSDKFIFNSEGINHKLDVGDTIVAIGYEKDLSLFRTYIEGDKI